MSNFFQRLTVFFIFGGLLAASSAWSQDRPYREGSVWIVSFVKTKNGLGDDYLREIVPARKKLMDEAQKQGLIISYKTLSGSAMGRDDWDIMFLDEYKNWAAFDGATAKFDAIMAKLVGDPTAQTQLMTKRIEVRELIGDKVMQELIAK